MADQTLRVTGLALTCADVRRAASGPIRVDLDQHARHRAEQAWRLAVDLAGRREVYGRTTGVGANRDTTVTDSRDEHGMRLLRSHAGGAGEPVPPGQASATMLVRLNQLAAGGSGVTPRLLDTLANALTAGAVPRIHRVGAIGTGDLTALAELGLTLAGERPWHTRPAGTPEPVPLGTADALALMSSNAATLAAAALAQHDLDRLLRAGHLVAALSFLALGGAPEAYAAPVHLARPHPGQVAVAERLRDLLDLPNAPGAAHAGRRIQDPFGLRAVPQVHGPAVDALRYCAEVLTVELNSGTENPLVSVPDQDVFHHANFHSSYVAAALDRARAAVHQVGQLSVARLGDLVEPGYTGLSPFLAAGPPGSSGVMILEYVAHDALATLRHAAAPVTLGTAVLSRGAEDHAGFATHAARLAGAAADALRLVLASELVAAVRAIRMSRDARRDCPASRACDRITARLTADLDDRPLSDDVTAAATLLDDLAGTTGLPLDGGER